MNIKDKILFIVLMFIGVLGGIISVCDFISELKLTILCKKEIEATLVEVKVNWKSEKGKYYKTYLPVYRYQYDHCWYKSESQREFYRYSEGKKYEEKIIRIGRKYKIFIDPLKPKNCIPSRFNKDTVMHLLGDFLFGLLIFIVAGYVLYKITRLH